jgi:diguanylate cyclase (GGDEF)-like protein
MMFDQVANDALKFNYPIALLCIGIDDIPRIRQRWGYGSADESAQIVIQSLLPALAETDLLFRYSDDQLILLSPKTSRDEAEELKSRVQDVIDRASFDVRPETRLHLAASIGIVLFPEDESTLERLVETANWRMTEDRDLRKVANSQRRLSL